MLQFHIKISCTEPQQGPPGYIAKTNAKKQMILLQTARLILLLYNRGKQEWTLEKPPYKGVERDDAFRVELDFNQL